MPRGSSLSSLALNGVLRAPRRFPTRRMRQVIAASLVGRVNCFVFASISRDEEEEGGSSPTSWWPLRGGGENSGVDVRRAASAHPASAHTTASRRERERREEEGEQLAEPIARHPRALAR
eukprot:scaffold132070_cov32-Tisochrysis_lutea.AAC.2